MEGDDDDQDENEEQQELSARFSLKTKPKPSHGMTESEQRYEAIRKQRLADKVRKEAKKSHKERVAEFNDKLEGMSEHYDLPRVSCDSILNGGWWMNADNLVHARRLVQDSQTIQYCSVVSLTCCCRVSIAISCIHVFEIQPA